MTRLLLIRHAKSSWREPELDDHLRPLSARGYRAAALMGQQAIIQANRPVRVLCSSAVRTYTTAQALLAPLGVGTECLQLEEALYLASADEMAKQIQRHMVETLWVIGHNPGIETLALRLGANMVAFPTLAVAAFNIHNQQLECTTCVDVLTPRECIDGEV